MSEEKVSSEETAVKSAFVSKGVIGGALAAFSGVLIMFGVGFSAEDAQNLGDLIDVVIDRALGISAAVGGVLAILGRIKADTKLKFPWQKG